MKEREQELNSEQRVKFSARVKVSRSPWTYIEIDWISYVEAEDVAAAATRTLVDSSTVDTVSRRPEVLTAIINTPINTPIKCTLRTRVSMKLPTLTEAQILGVKHPIVKGIARLCVTKNPTASLVAIIHCHRDMLSAYSLPLSRIPR